MVKSLPADARDRRPRFGPWFGKIPLEEGTATHSSILAWKIPVTEEPGGLQSTGSQRVGHNQSDLARTALVASYPFLKSIYSFPVGIGSQLRHAGSFVAAHRHLGCSTEALAPCSTWDLGSLSRDGTRVPCLRRRVPNHCMAGRKVLPFTLEHECSHNRPWIGIYNSKQVEVAGDWPSPRLVSPSE